MCIQQKNNNNNHPTYKHTYRLFPPSTDNTENYIPLPPDYLPANIRILTNKPSYYKSDHYPMAEEKDPKINVLLTSSTSKSEVEIRTPLFTQAVKRRRN